MTKDLCISLFFIGIIIVVCGGGAPIKGFKNNKKLMSKYRKSKALGEQTTLDQRGAYYTVLFYKIGGGIIGLSIFFYVFILWR
jgi:hypothetical protein